MICVTLADGSQKKFDQAKTVLSVIESIGPELAKVALAGKLDGKLVDLAFLIQRDVGLKVITDRDSEGLEIIRHSCAHLLAHAVKNLFPSAKTTTGPVIKDGFYYDIAFERAFTPDDLKKITSEMKSIAKANYPVEQEVFSHDEAIRTFEAIDEHYKVQIIRDISVHEKLTVYKQSKFIDLCFGLHVPRTSMIKAFQLTKLAGVYWRGDSNNEMLQRIYGTAWPDKKSLNTYLKCIEEAERRDHRKIGKKMDLFHFQKESPGMVFWHPNGWILNSLIQSHLRKVNIQSGYVEINTPQIVDLNLWEQSGHLKKFGEEMFHMKLEHREYAVKPMSCPCHVQVFNQGLKSYRDLPLRFSEFGYCHRNEPSGTLHGLMRVRAMVQDDGHIFSMEDQIHFEVLAFIQQLHSVYRDFGFLEIIHKLSTRPDKRVGTDSIWDKAEKALSHALDASGVEWEILPGEGAFYGPKIEFSLKDCLGRIWQCGTIQVDFSMPARLNAEYVGEDGNKHTPVMLHRAILGSIERFIGILLEHYAGYLPVWLAPNQVVVMNVTERQSEYVVKIKENLKNLGFRVISDLRNKKISYKIREHTIARIPYQLVIGDRELFEKTVSLRQENNKSVTMQLQNFIDQLRNDIDQKLIRGENNYSKKRTYK